MKYTVIEGFYDLQDPDGKGRYYLYNRGDVYPREGLEPTEARIAELSGKDNKRNQPLIEEIAEQEETRIEEIVEQEEPKKRKTRKAE